MTYLLRQSARSSCCLTSSLRPSAIVPRCASISLHSSNLYHTPQSQSVRTISSLKDKIPYEAMEAVKKTVAENMGVSQAHSLVPEDQQFSLEQTPDLSGKVAVVTGSLHSFSVDRT